MCYPAKFIQNHFVVFTKVIGKNARGKTSQEKRPRKNVPGKKSVGVAVVLMPFLYAFFVTETIFKWICRPLKDKISKLLMFGKANKPGMAQMGNPLKAQKVFKLVRADQN